MSGRTAPFHPPASFLEVAARLEAAGFEAWAVGGALRDELLGRIRKDWDLATDARPADVRALFRRTVALGQEHGTVGVIASDETMYEVTTFRLDIQTDGRHAVVEFADTVEDDLARRDFTINALAWRPATGEFRDPFGGRADLEGRRLQAVGDPSRRFAEDHLRVLRGLRFAGSFGLELDPETRGALVDGVSLLPKLSAERVREELVKVLSGPIPEASLRLYEDTGALGSWYPELAEAAATGYGWSHALEALGRIGPHRAFLRLVRLLRAIPDEDGGGAHAAQEVMRRLRFSNAEIRRAVHLYEHYLPLVHPADSAARMREWLAEVGTESARDLFRLHFADARAQGDGESTRGLAYTWRRVHEELTQGRPLRLKDLALDGDDLLELGLPRGPLVGLILEELLAQVLEAPELNDRDELLRRARELIQLGSLDRLTSE